MSLSAFQVPISSNPVTQFTEALAQDAGSVNTDLVLPWRTPAQVFIRAITLIATQNLEYELQLFRKAVNMGATIALDEFLAVWQFGQIAAQQPGYPFTPSDKAANGFFHYYIDGNMMPYRDLDAMLTGNTGDGTPNPANPKLHVRLINRSVTAKNAGDTGALALTFWVSPQGEQV